MAALHTEENAETARFVGGCVRNALLGCKVDDVDIATTLAPETVVERIEAAGLKAVPTGLEHGTVTAVAKGRPFEITTLRRDVETDGRRAVVAFTEDWTEDAKRRDFTLNALYAGADGTLHDPLGGLPDLEAGRVRFIGDPVERIREDYLRILRFFRIHAWYGQGALDTEGLKAVTAEKAGLETLSGERVQKELLKLLEADDPRGAVSAMAAGGVLEAVLPEAGALETFERLLDLQADLDGDADGLLRLAALVMGKATETDLDGLAERLRLSNALRKRLSRLLRADHRMIARAGAPALRALSYRTDPEDARALLLLAAAHAGGPPPDMVENLAMLGQWTPPRFPLTGADVMALGVPKGPQVGKALSAVEQAWIDGDFQADKAALKAMLADVTARS